MKLTSIFIGLLMLGMLWGGCKPDPPIDEEGLVNLEIQPTLNGADFALNTDFQNPADRRTQIERLFLYVSDVYLVPDSGEEILLTDPETESPALLFKFGATLTDAGHEATSRTFTVPAGEYRGLKLSLGVPENLNNQDPAIYSNAHALSITNGTHWSWNNGYIFLMLDGSIDSSPTKDGASLDLGLTYHCGTNALRKDLVYLDLEDAFQVQTEGSTTLSFGLEVNKLFTAPGDSIDMTLENFTHTAGAGVDLATRIMNNLSQEAFEKKPF
ncbi:MAG: MbnP family protein [Bacteroidota bacterium]